MRMWSKLKPLVPMLATIALLLVVALKRYRAADEEEEAYADKDNSSKDDNA